MRRRNRGFTLVELVVVIVIVLILASLLLPAIFRAWAKVRETDCMNNLSQLGKGLIMYRQDNRSIGRELHPLRLTHLYSMKYAENPDLYVCPLDGSEGEEGGKPDGVATDQYAELDEEPDPPTYAKGALFCSYLYEFCMASECSWGWESYLTLPSRAASDKDKFINLDTNPSMSMWGEVKSAQLKYGDTWINDPGEPESRWHGYSHSKFPVLRCFWHTDDPNSDADVNAIINLAYAGQPFKSGAEWERATKPW
jgi:prepilin-type N-terminal cleavage/methylation domain-containing protein